VKRHYTSPPEAFELEKFLNISDGRVSSSHDLIFIVPQCITNKPSLIFFFFFFDLIRCWLHDQN